LVDASKSAAACKDSTQAGSMSRKQATDGTKTFLPQAGVPAGHAGHDVLLVVSCEESWQGTMASTPGKAQWQGRLARNCGHAMARRSGKAAAAAAKPPGKAQWQGAARCCATPALWLARQAAQAKRPGTQHLQADNITSTWKSSTLQSSPELLLHTVGCRPLLLPSTAPAWTGTLAQSLHLRSRKAAQHRMQPWQQ
jgi:hypothetical protein